MEGRMKIPWIHKIVVKNRIYLFAIIALTLPGPLSLSAEIYTPPGYSQGQSLGKNGYGIDAGIMTLAEDYYFVLTPSVAFSFWKIGIGLQIPLEILAYDRDPKGDKKTGSIREGSYDSVEDLAKLVTYVRYGTHGYFDPDKLFNWSVYLGRMNNGYLGHKTIINRYVTSYDPTIYRAGLMADINNKWGGIEVFKSDIFRNEVAGGRVYIRPVHWAASIRNLLFAHSSLTDPKRMIAMSPSRDPDANGGVFYQERIPRQGVGGRLRQHTYRTLRQDTEDLQRRSTGEVRFEEVEDPVTGEVQVRAVEEPLPPPGEADIVESAIESVDDQTGREGRKGGGAPPASVKEGEVAAEEKAAASDNKPSDPWTSGWWSRWAIGYSLVKDSKAPLSLEVDGSGNLVIDPETGLPRTDKGESLYFTGIDTELRLSPWSWIDLTPYVDYNRIRSLDKSNALHVGVDSVFRLSETMTISFRPEYRSFSSNYIPEYFDSYYTVERTRYNPNGDAGSDGTTKLAYLKSLPRDGEKTKGVFANFMFEWTEIVVTEVNFEDYEGASNSRIFVGIYVPDLFGFFINGYYEKKYFDTFKQAFDYDENSMMAGEIGYNLFGGFYLKATLYRTWQLDQNTSTYVADDEVVYGFGFSSDL